MRLTALFPLACAIAAFILSMLCLFAGSKPNFMEGYDIATLNVSTLGHNVINATRTSSSSSSQPSSILSWLESEAGNITADIKDELNKIAGDIADKLAGELGIQQWYSFHLMDMCQGSYSPNATAPGAGKNSSMNCSAAMAMYHFDPISSIDAALANSTIGRELRLNISSLDWPEELTDGIQGLNTLTTATFILYCIGIAFTGLAILGAILAFFLHGSRIVSFLNWGTTGLAFVTLGIASAIVTAIMVKVSNLVNTYGNQAGVYAYKGNKFLALTWAGTGLMFVASIAWVVEFCIGRRREKKVYTEKMTGARGWKGKF